MPEQIIQKERKWLLIYLAPNYLRKALIQFNSAINESPENIFSFEAEEWIDLYSTDNLFACPDKPISKRDQLEIIYKIREWVKDFEKQNSILSSANQENTIIILAPQEIQLIEGISQILAQLKAQLGLQIQFINSLECARQSFMGAKLNLSNYRNNSRLVHIDLKQNEILIVFGDLFKQEQIIRIEFGVQEIADLINILRKQGNFSALPLFIKAKLYCFIEQIRLLSKPQLITFDENTSRLLAKGLTRDEQSQRINSDWIRQLAHKITDSNFQYLINSVDWVNSESLDYVSAHFILLSYLLEALDTNICCLDKDPKLKGFLIDNLLENGELEELFGGHKNDWKKSAFEVLIRLSSSEFNNSMQLANLCNKAFESSFNWLHKWNERDKKILWISAFFNNYLAKLSSEVAFEILQEVQGFNYSDYQIIASVIGLSSIRNLSGQSKYLDLLPPSERSKARKMASLIQLAKALNITGRSAISDISFENKFNNKGKALLKIWPRLNAEPELIQLNILKKSFENQFEKKLETEVF